VSDSIGFNRVPFGDENQAETLFREYLEQLVASLAVDRVRSSCARERALLTVVDGAFDAARTNSGTLVPREDVFERLAEVFGWCGGEAELLKLWVQLYPQPRDFATKQEWDARIQDARELFRSDPYSRHATFWGRCERHGYDSFMAWWGYRNPDQFATTVKLIDEAAKALGDE
jgi:hypothetical protein